MKLKDCQTIQLPSFCDMRGSLTLLDGQAIAERLPFRPKRCFWIHNVTKQNSRGEHAHRTCWEVVFAVSGQFSLTLHDGKDEKTFMLDSPNKGVVIPPMVWCRLWDFTDSTVCLTFASEDYDATGYINDFKEFLNVCVHD